jgi:hypothetical protein
LFSPWLKSPKKGSKPLSIKGEDAQDSEFLEIGAKEKI